MIRRCGRGCQCSARSDAAGLSRQRARGVLIAVELRKQKEAYTRTAFLDPLLKLLGWHFIPEANLPHGPTKKRPDYALFPDAARCENAAAASDATDIFRLAETVLEAKRWQHPLDEASSSDTPGWFPSEQIQDYLRHARDAIYQRGMSRQSGNQIALRYTAAHCLASWL